MWYSLVLYNRTCSCVQSKHALHKTIYTAINLVPENTFFREVFGLGNANVTRMLLTSETETHAVCFERVSIYVSSNVIYLQI